MTAAQYNVDWQGVLKLLGSCLLTAVTGFVGWLTPMIYEHDKAIGIQAQLITSIKENAYTAAEAKADRREMASEVSEATRDLRLEIRELRQELLRWRTAMNGTDTTG